MVGLLTSCTTRTVVIDARHDVVRLGNNVLGTVYVWSVPNQQWEKVNVMKLPEGWYAGPMDMTLTNH